MTVAAASVFAQVIPVLLVAAFLSGVRINQRDRIATMTGIVYTSLSAAAEGVCLIYVAVDKPMPYWLMFGVLTAALLLLVALIATVVQKLSADEEDDRNRKGE